MARVPAPRIDKRRAGDHLRLVLDAPLEIAGRRQQGLRAELVPEWSPVEEPPEGTRLDFGLVLTRLFARLMDGLTERLNRVPEKHFTAFLDLLGIERLPGSPARVPVTFTPAPKTPPGRNVPAGTQVATTQSATEPARVFETEEGFDLTAVLLARAFTIDPAGDRYRDVKADLDDPAAGPALVLASAAGDPAVEHALYLAHEGLFAPGPERDLTLRFALATPAAGLSVAWERFDGERWVRIDLGSADGSAWLAAPATDLTVRGFTGTEKTSLDGREAHWIRARLTGPLTAASGPAPEIDRVAVAAAPPAGRAIPPDQAFTNSSPVDLNKDFYPFGPKPARNDAFYLTSLEALVNPEPAVPRQVDVRLRLAQAPGAAAGQEFPDPAATAVLTWEYFSRDAGAWRAIGGVIDGTSNLKTGPPADPGGSHTVSFEIPPDLGMVTVNGVEGPWIRARVTSGDYGREAQSSLTVVSNTISSYTFTPATFRPPFLSVSHFALGYGAGAGTDPFVPLTGCAARNHFLVTDHLAASADAGPPGFRPFTTLAEQGETEPALYLGYSGPFGNLRVSQLLELVPPDAAGLRAEDVEPRPRLAWEYRSAAGSWRRLDARDGTRVLSNTGTVAFTAPSDMAADTRFGHRAHWLRARLESGALAVERRLRGLHLNTVWAQGIRTVRDEVLGSGSGEAPQTFRLSQAPLVAGEVLRVREAARPSDAEIAALTELEEALARRLGVDPVPVVASRTPPRGGAVESWVRWYPVGNFRFSTAADRHYAIDRVSGEVTFGAMPVPLGRDNVMAELYRATGGAVGSAGGKGKVAQLKSPLPFVAAVANPVEAAGGSAPESLAATLERGPQALKHRDKAVTIEDFAALVREASTRVARVRTLPVTNPALERELGAVTVVIVPASAEARPSPQPELIDQVRRHLARRACETMAHRIYVVGPTYVEVGVAARVAPVDPGLSSVVVDRVAAALTAYLHPLTGGRRGAGWDFGRAVHLSEIFTLIEGVEGVDHVAEASFVGAPGATRIEVGPVQLVMSGAHAIEAASGAAVTGS